MKKSIFLTLLLAAFFVGNANSVDVDAAKAIGTKFLKASTNLKSVPELTLVTTYQIDRGDAAFYVFNATDGFVIVAADDCATPILAYSDKGSFDVVDIPPAMQAYLEGFVEQIEYGIENNISADEKTAGQWQLVKATGRMHDERNTPVVGPLVTATWWQNTYYNRMCPEDPKSSDDGHVLVGCVATAMGEIMHYYKWPETGNGTHSYTPSGYPTQTANFGATTYDWNNMPNNLISTSTETQINAVALLLWHCGVSVNMNYGLAASGANSVNVPNALLSYFRYSTELSYAEKKDFDDAVWLAMVKACLDKERPLYYSAASVNALGQRSGHAFVCDGYDADDKLHFNWGWNGGNNGYYALSAMNPGSFKFKFQHAAIFNIHPDKDATTQHTVSVSSNDNDFGTATISGNGEFNYGEKATATATANSGYIFNYWSENGAVVSTENTYSFDVTYDRNLVANFSTPNNITITPSVYNNIGGAVSASADYSYGETAEVTATANDDYVFMYWLEGTEIVSSENPYSFTATENRSLQARFAPASNVCEIVFTLDDYYKDGWNGNKLNVKYENTFTEALEPNVGNATAFTRKVVNGTQVQLSWTLGLYVDECRFSLKNADGVVFYDVPSVNPKNYSYTFYMNCSGISGCDFNGTNSNLWSESSNWASGTKPTSTAIANIKTDVTVDENVTVGTLNVFDNQTVTINAGCTLTVAGTIAQLSGSNIILEDGAQLVNQTQDIYGTVKKDVIAWTTTPSDNGWYAISTPINDINFMDVTNLTNEIYNVYRYDEPTMTWENCLNSNNQFNVFESGRGYLYRRNVEATLEFNGTITTSYVGYRLSYTAANGNLKGFHLIGNPYPHNIYKGANTAFYNYNYLEDGFYTLQTNGTWLAGTDNSTAIKPCEAILVQAKDFVTDQYVLYFVNETTSGASKDAENLIKFTVSNNNYEDVAYAIFKEGKGLNKVEHRNVEAQMLYIHNNDEDFAVADIDESTTSFYMNFKAATTGYYTLKIDAEGDFRYLHVIDKITGKDVDILSEGKYSFIGSPSDDDERFVVLIEGAGNSDASDNSIFAYQNGNDIIVSGEGILQIFDVTGRIVSTQSVFGVETIRKPSQNGVYILRLLGNDIKTQKIVIQTAN